MIKPRFLLSLLVCYIVLQVMDGIFTYIAIGAYGYQLEGNPLVRWLMQATNLELGLLCAKIFGIMLGVILYAHHARWALVVVNLVYAVFMVIPWMIALSFLL